MDHFSHRAAAANILCAPPRCRRGRIPSDVERLVALGRHPVDIGTDDLALMREANGLD